MKQPPLPQQHSSSRTGLALFLTGILLLGVLSAALFAPSVARAQSNEGAKFFNDPGVQAGLPVADYAKPAENVLDFIGSALVTAARVGIKNALRSFLEKLAYDAAVFIASAGEKQKPLVFTEDIGTYFANALDAATGEYLNTLASENGFAELNLCNLSAPEKLQFQVFLPQLLGQEPYKPDCTLSEIKQSFADFGDNIRLQAVAIMDDPQGLVSFSRSYNLGSNYMGSLLTAFDEATEAEFLAKEKAQAERAKGDFKDKEAKISGYIQTPGAVVQTQFETAVNKASEGETTQQGNVIADALSVFVNTLTSKLVDRLASGLISFFTETDIGDSIAGGSSLGGGSAGIRGAQDRFAELKTPSFATGGQLDILTRFASCTGPAGMDTTNCVVHESLRQAIEEGMSVREAMEQGLLDSSLKFGTEVTEDTIQAAVNEGIPTRNIKILKAYSVVPVGWVLAAEYIREFDSQKTLGQVVDAYDDCSSDNYSPYCGLVDPDWTLKAPEVFCKVEGFGETIATDDTFIDYDGSEFTPEQQLITRINTCLDFQTCLSEDENGVCEGGQYGYCTKQKPVYRFQGDSCPAYQASCDIYTNSDEEEVAYLENTLNFNDCSVDNVGCQWNCGVYNEADQAFQCAGQGLVYNTCNASTGCFCSVSTSSGTEDCAIVEGGFKCDLPTLGVCTLGTHTDDAFGIDSTITFDNNVRTCSEKEDGCTQFSAVKGGANLLFNSSLEQFNSFQSITPDALNALSAISSSDPYDDTFAFYGSNGDGVDPNTPGQPCSVSTDPSYPCYGWEKTSGVQTRAVSESLYGSVAVQMQANAGGTQFIRSEFDTGQPLANRSFVLSYAFQNPDVTDCTGYYYIAEDSNAAADLVEVTYPSGEGFDFVTGEVITFGPSVTDSVVAVGVSQGDTCNLVIDGVQLEEGTGASGYSDYNGDSFFMNVNKTNACTVEEIGCELYEPETGESELPIPGIITNPLSEACGDGNDFTDPSCSQCLQQFIGCDAYIQSQTPYNAPVLDGTGFSNFFDPAFDTTLASAIAQRGGYYCDGTATPCSPGREAIECGGDACLPSVSIMPATGDKCSAAHVGCEEYINLDTVAAGGEGVEYYKYIKQCVKPTAAQENTNQIGTYFTFEGSDQTGYQIRSWTLKKSDDVDSSGSGAPCTNLDFYGSTAQTPEAGCIDLTQGAQTCNALDVGVDPDCTEYFDASGNVYYRLRSATITVSESCVGLRNSLDNRVYYSIPAESASCPASANLCREYNGSEGGNVQIILADDFDGGVWPGGEASGTVVTANSGQSLAIGEGTINQSTEAKVIVGNDVEEGESYVVTFWAKASDAATTLDTFFFSTETGNYSYFDTTGVELTTEWNRYTMGPFLFNSAPIGDEEFGFGYNGVIGGGSIAYIDNMELQKSTAQYIINGTADSCNGYEGCEQYTDTSDQTQYLKSFTGLCSEAAVGCEAVIDTNNNDTPYYTVYNTQNEFPVDDVPVDVDSVSTYVVTPSAFCQSEFAGCGLFGIPTLNMSGTPTAYTARYAINDPDEYDTILCQEQQRSCEQFASSEGTTEYFKDPGEKTCEHIGGTSSWLAPDGTECPVRSLVESPSQPVGPICNGGIRNGLSCNRDVDCPAGAGDPGIYRCLSNIDLNSGWVGVCDPGFAGCTEYTDPNTENLITNGDFETDVEDNDDITSGIPDNIPDGWADVATLSDPTLIPNGFATADNKEIIPCATFTIRNDIVHTDRNSIQIMRQGEEYGKSCMVSPSSFGNPSGAFYIDPSKVYTLSGNVWLGSVNQRVAIGLHYYDAGGNEITTFTNPEDYAIAAYEGTNRGSTAGLTSQWLRFSAHIGGTLNRTFPQNTAYVRIFVESATDGGGTLIDNIAFTENESYTYINNTVDGATESDENSCNGEVNIAQGCVAFRDATSDSLTDLSVIEAEKNVNTGFATGSCTFDPASGEGCDSLANAADTNVVVQVRNDRECAEWLSCSSSIPVDANGDGIYEKAVCEDIRRCMARNPVTGVCSKYAATKSLSALGANSDLSITLSPDNELEVQTIANASGYTTVGAEWVGTCIVPENATDGICVGGANDGQVCSALSNPCADAPRTVLGFYPFDWIPQRGAGATLVSGEIVPNGNFEDVTCSGVTQYDEYFSTLSSPLETVRDRSASCTLDRHCRSLAAETQLQTMAADSSYGIPSGTDLDTVPYEQGWCANVEAGAWEEWSVNGSGDIEVIDYDQDRSYQREIDVPPGGSLSAIGLDLNNVMLVSPANFAESGVAVDLGANIQNGQEYTLSFDARYLSSPNENTDFIQIRLEHSGEEGAADYFEGADQSLDLVVILNISANMASSIANVADNLDAMLEGLIESGIDVNVGIVTTGWNSPSNSTHVLDFSDYYSGPTPIASKLGATNGITEPFTSNPAALGEALQYIDNQIQNGNLFGNDGYNYEALMLLAENNFTYDANFEYPFRGDAVRAGLLVVNNSPATGDPYIDSPLGIAPDYWTPGDEDAMINDNLPPDPFTLYSFTPTSGSGFSAYDGITEHLGGQVFDIDAPDYDVALSTIASQIVTAVSTFQFSNHMERYTLGPITIENKEDPSYTTELHIVQSAGAGNIPFVIDNVSLMPSAEVNKEGNPHSDSSTNLISRDCRGYPEATAAECDYVDNNGSINTGWKGYCLLRDEISDDRCVQWWPVDVIAGEADYVALGAAIPVAFNGPAPLYHCLVAKGNADLGACTDTGVICTENSQCDNNECLGNGVTEFSTPSPYISVSNTNEINTPGDYTLERSIQSVLLDLMGSHANSQPTNQEVATFLSFEPSVTEQLIHISEIDKIVFSIGEPSYDNSNNPSEEKKAWTVRWNEPAISANGFNSANWEGQPTLFESNFVNEAVDIWDQESTQGGTGLDKDAAYAWQAGAWCGDEPCSAASMTVEDLEDVDFVYVKGITQAHSGGMLSQTGGVANGGEPLNPFNEFNQIKPECSFCIPATGSAWNSVTDIDGGDGYDDEYFYSRHSNPADTDNADGCWNSGGGSSGTWCGANVMGFKIDFEDGYIEKIYLFYWDGFRRFDASQITDVFWRYYLKEPCLLAVEAADEDLANVVPWQTRANASGSYAVQELYYTPYMDGLGSSNVLNPIFGALGNDVNGSSPLEMDGITHGANLLDFTALAPNNLPFVFSYDAVAVGVPFACIGSCGDNTTAPGEFPLRCQLNYSESYGSGSTCNTAGSQWLGAPGICTTFDDDSNVIPAANPTTGNAELCNDDTDCSVSGANCSTAEAISADGVGTQYNTYEEQLTAAAQSAWERYRLLFASVGNFWYAPVDEENASRNAPFLFDQGAPPAYLSSVLSSNDVFDADNNGVFDYNEMPECAEISRDPEDYCYYRPTVSNIALNANGIGDLEIPSGSSATLSFDANVDADQQPLDVIRIEWEGEDVVEDFDTTNAQSIPWQAAAQNNHVITHVYTCDPLTDTIVTETGPNGEDIVYCPYRVKVQITDHWENCSGNLQTGVTRSVTGSCTSYDQYDGVVKVMYN